MTDTAEPMSLFACRPSLAMQLARIASRARHLLAIVTLAALTNALKVVGKALSEVRLPARRRGVLLAGDICWASELLSSSLVTR